MKKILYAFVALTFLMPISGFSKKNRKIASNNSGKLIGLFEEYKDVEPGPGVTREEASSANRRAAFDALKRMEEKCERYAGTTSNWKVDLTDRVGGEKPGYTFQLGACIIY